MLLLNAWQINIKIAEICDRQYKQIDKHSLSDPIVTLLSG